MPFFQRWTNRRRRLVIANNELHRMALNYLSHLGARPTDSPALQAVIDRARMYAQFKLSAMPPATSMTRLNRMCIMTGRGRAIIPEYDVSRIEFRRLALAGKMEGVTKSSW